MKQADVKLETGQATILYEEQKQTPGTLAAAIDRLGFRATLVSVTPAPTSGLSVRP